MGDRVTIYASCPKCKGKNTFECYEALSSLLKVDNCTKCGFTQHYEVSDDDNVITVKKVKA